MEKQLEQVRDFHRRIGAVVAPSPRLLDHDRDAAVQMASMVRGVIATMDRRAGPRDELAKRTLMALEELAEWIEAHGAGDLTAAADAWADRAYLLFGDAVTTGLPAAEVFDEVHRSNMTKSVAHPDTGKGVKSDGYVAPTITVGRRDGPVNVTGDA